MFCRREKDYIIYNYLVFKFDFVIPSLLFFLPFLLSSSLGCVCQVKTRFLSSRDSGLVRKTDTKLDDM